MSRIATTVLERLGALHRFHREMLEIEVEARRVGYWSQMEPLERVMCQRGAVMTTPNALSASTALWVSADMMNLLRHSSTSLPLYAFDADVLPWQNAVVFSDSPFFVHSTGETTRPVEGMQWRRLDERHYLIGALARGNDGNLFYRLIAGIEQGDRLEVAQEAAVSSAGITTAVDQTETPEKMARLLCTLWLLLRQRVAVKTVVQGERQARRRFERENHREPPTVTVIELRRPLSGDSTDPQHTAVDWSHRWIVDGHWRNQYHPSTDSHVPTWIAPYVKGPDDKPLVVKERVHAWVR